MADALDRRRRPHAARQGPTRRRAPRRAPAGAARAVPPRRWPTRIGFDPVDVDDVIAGNGILTGDHDARRPAGDAAGRLARDRPGHHAQPVLRIRPAGDHLRGHGRRQRSPGPGGRRRRRVDVAAGTSPPARSTIDGGNPDFRARVPHRAAGHLGRPDRHARGLQPRRRRHVRRREPAPRRRSPSTKAASTAACRGDRPRRRSAARPRRAPAPGHDASRAWRSCGPRSPEMGAHVRRSRASALPAVDHIDHVHHAGNSSGVVDGAAAALGRVDDWVRGPRPHRRVPGSAPRPRSAPSR